MWSRRIPVHLWSRSFASRGGRCRTVSIPRCCGRWLADAASRVLESARQHLVSSSETRPGMVTSWMSHG
ncbi:MAG TPA: hypothetical protein VFV38_43430 [Ktedonobacteraceae bacterium]|nr:hypothetical protein [Ktedonobacteraceae bacterium]